MPLNLLKKYNALLDIAGMNPKVRTDSLRGIFNRDIQNNTRFRFRGKEIHPTSKDGEIPMETLFTHLTTEITDYKTMSREFDYHRSVRLHWIKHHVDERKKDEMLVFSCKDKNGDRTYIYDKTELYVIVLEPKNNKNEYFLLTAYYLRGRNKFKIEKKYKRRLNELL
jgi:hypothetical protein